MINIHAIIGEPIGHYLDTQANQRLWKEFGAAFNNAPLVMIPCDRSIELWEGKSGHYVIEEIVKEAPGLIRHPETEAVNGDIEAAVREVVALYGTSGS